MSAQEVRPIRSDRRTRPTRVRARRPRQALLASLLAVLAACVAAPAAPAALDNSGTDFWVGFVRNHTGAQKTLFITGEQATTGTVAVPGLSFSQSFSVTPGTVTSVALPAGAEMAAGEGTQSVGVHVTAASEVAVYGLSRIQASTDAFLGLPTDVLATDYTVMAWGPGAAGRSEIGIVATRDGTTATITPAVATSGGHAAGVPYDVTLDAGQMYQLQASAFGADLTGTTIDATAAVAVFGGHQCANVPSIDVLACDHIVEQIQPDETWGTAFLTVPLKTRSGGDTFKFLATEDGTQIAVNGENVVTLDAGQQHQMLVQGQATINSSKPILVAQFSNGTTFDNVTSDPFMMLIAPFEQFEAGYTVTTPASGFTFNFVNLVVPDSAVGSVLLDGNAVPSQEFSPIGSSGFQGAQLDLSLGQHTITGGGQPFGAFVYGFDQADSYGYPGGLSLAPIARVDTIGLSPATATHTVGTQACVDATVIDTQNARVPGVRVDFAVTGVNEATESVVADDQGQARFCYTGANAGTDTITGSVGAVSGTATKTWTTTPQPEPQTGLTIGLTPAAATHPVGTPQCVTATVVDAQNAPVAGVNVDFAVSGANGPNAATGSSGVGGTVGSNEQGQAQFCYTAANVGDDTITATAGGVTATATKTWVAGDGGGPSTTPGDRDADGILDALDTSDASAGPTLGQIVVARVVSGEVFVRIPPPGFVPRAGARAAQATRPARPLKGAELIPVGSVVDTSEGRVAITSDVGDRTPAGSRRVQSSEFFAGIFQVRQARRRGGLTDITLRSRSAAPYDRVCGRAGAGSARAAKGGSVVAAQARRRSRRVVSRLWADSKGRFRTNGRNSAATVRGTVWLTENRCDGTRTVVREGVVSVRERGTNRVVTVRAGESHFARAVRATVRTRRP